MANMVDDYGVIDINKFNRYNKNETQTTWWKPTSWIKWKTPSMLELMEAEENMLKEVWDRIDRKYTSIMGGSEHIHSISMNTESTNTPVVLLHGMGSGVGLWCKNLQSLAANRPVFAIDILGFGASSRFKFGKESMIVEDEFIESIEEWRSKNNIEKFILLGHSMGGYLSMSYALKYPKRLHHLIMVDPWGMAERPPPNSPLRTPMPLWIRVLANAMQTFNPLSALRAAGPYGARVVSFFRTDLIGKFNHSTEITSNYIYNCNAHNPTGEEAFGRMSIPIGWAKNPMIKRLVDMHPSVQMSLMYGSRSWIDNAVGYQMKYMRDSSYVDVQVFKGAGHHVYADKCDEFNSAVNRICRTVDQERDQGFSDFSMNNRRRQVHSDTSLTSGNNQSLPYLNRYVQSESITEEKSSEVSQDEDKTMFTCGPNEEKEEIKKADQIEEKKKTVRIEEKKKTVRIEEKRKADKIDEKKKANLSEANQNTDPIEEIQNTEKEN